MTKLLPNGGNYDSLDVLSPIGQGDEFGGETPDPLAAAKEQDWVGGEGLQSHCDDGDQYFRSERV